MARFALSRCIQNDTPWMTRRGHVLGKQARTNAMALRADWENAACNQARPLGKNDAGRCNQVDRDTIQNATYNAGGDRIKWRMRSHLRGHAHR